MHIATARRAKFCDATGEQPTAEELRAAAAWLARIERREMSRRLSAAVRYISDRGSAEDMAAWLDLLWLVGQLANDRPRRAMVAGMFARLEAAGAIKRVDDTKH